MPRKHTRLLVYGLIIVLQALVVISAFALGYVYSRQDRRVASPAFSLLDQAYDLLAREGLKDLPSDEQLQRGMIRGMVEAYGDPFTTYLEPAQNELQTDQLEGKFGGIGVRLLRDNEQNVLIYPYPDSPAIQAGVQDGDILTAVNQLVIAKETNMADIEASIRGPVGEPVELNLVRGPEKTLYKTSILRAEFPLPSVNWFIAPQQPAIGVVQINTMAEITPFEVQSAVRDLQERGANRLILDLRNNTGGLVDAGIDLARLFLPGGVIIQQQYKGKEPETISISQPGEFSDIPLAVLINKTTASSAEILAGALQANRRGILIGTESYGKNSIQLVFELADHSSLHITAAQWWVPGLEPGIGEGGLQPDIVLPDESSDTDFMLAAVENLLQ